MKKKLCMVLFAALLLCGFNLKAQESTPDVSVSRGENFELIKILNSYHWPYDISNNKKHVAIQGFGASDSYYWSEETGALALSGYAFAISDEGKMAGSYTNELGMNVAGLWSPETKKWEFLGMNPDVPEFSSVEGDFEYNGAWSMTNDGSKVGIMQIYPDWSTTSYIWTKENGYTKLPNGDSPGTRPNAISDDGKVIAGLATHKDKGEWTPCYWKDGEIHRFPHLFGEALNVSHNGNYVCGYLLDGNAFLYDIYNDELIKIVNTLELDFKVSATCVSNNGIVYGYSDGGTPSDRKAVVYIGGELLFFNNYLKMNGIEEAANWNIFSINNVSDDNKTFIGAGTIDGEECSFILNLDIAPCDGPKNLTYTIENTNNIILNWEAPENAENVTYDILINYTGAPFAIGLTDTTFTFDNMEAGEYQFLIRANWNNGACISEVSNMVKPTIYPCAENEKCELTIIACDYYADGWDNGYISFKGTKSELIYEARLSEGGDTLKPDTLTFALCPDKYQFTWIPGNWDEEVKFSFFFQDEEIYSIYFGSIDSTFKKKPMFFEYEIDCEPEDGINDIETVENINVRPNPAQDYFFIEGQNIVSVEVFNAIGQNVEKLEVRSNNVKINTSKYNEGIYFVKILSLDNKMEIKKVVISK